MTNCYVLGCEKTKQAIIIDAGDEADKILEIVDNNQYSVKYLINTHAHIDHVGAIQEIKTRENALFLLHEQEKPVLDSVPKMAVAFGMKIGLMPDVDEFVDSIVGIDNEISEVLFRKMVRVNGNIASLTAYYDWFKDGKKKHSGSIIFLLAKTNNGWKVIHKNWHNN